ncbi:DUF2509 family protein [Enterobacter sp. RHBSTW-00994]|uniref:DUF2509 family protein n=1 Tax=Enterobacter sp. RHBSTW-00994 TaxID=2742676 RepID=UPI0015EA41FC|nr:DUF2509 family protein [Enterobacter sp. RHBSTW-00994]QLR44445.1 DUF2509 family protein [Enterobacter sp. RHBSTW-00994]
MNRQRGMSSLAMVLLLLVLGSLVLSGLNQQLNTFSVLVGGESRSLQSQAIVQSALEWGRMQHWLPESDIQCKQAQPPARVCVKLLSDERVLLIAGNNDLLSWRTGKVLEGQIIFSPHGWSDFCPLKESALCQLP